jgi:putative ABC transport system permease protein
VTNKIVFENLKHRPMRTLLSVLLIGVPVTLILSLVGVSEGMSEDAQRRNRAIGADIVVRPSTASAAINYSGAPLSEGYIRAIEQQPHVKMAIGTIAYAIDWPLNMIGIDMDRFNALSGGFKYVAGGPLRQEYDMLLDQPYAEQRKKQVGDTLKLLNHEWHVVGIIQPGMLARVAVPKTTLQELTSATNHVSVIWVKVDDPNRADDVAKQLANAFPALRVETMSYYTSQFSPSNIAQVRVFRYVVIGIGVVIAFAVVCLTMYMAVLQRTREIGILKSLGGSKPFIVRIMMSEAALLGIGGTLLGILLSYGARWAINTFVPASFPMIIVHSWWPKAFLIAEAAALFGALYPGISAASHDPIEALAYE